MKKTGLFSIVILLLLVASVNVSFGQISSFPIQSKDIKFESDGFIYALPLHTLKVDVYITKTDKFKGKYSDFATKLLGLTDVISKDVSSYEIGEVKFSTLKQVDTTQLYYALIPQKLDDDKSIMINLSEEGFLSGFFSVKSDIDKKNESKSVENPFRDLLKPVLIEKVDTIIRRVSIDTTTIEEKVLKRSISEKSNEQQAREIADLIYRIEDSKFSLITGYQEVNYSKESLQFMLNKLNKMENEYLAFFKGSTQTSEEVYTFYYTPSEKTADNFTTLCSFSATDGITDKNSRMGDPVNLIVKPLHQNTKVKQFEASRSNAKRNSRGLYYRIPESVTIEIALGKKTIATNKTYISQLGILTFLPSSNLMKVDFNENGSLRSLILE